MLKVLFLLFSFSLYSQDKIETKKKLSKTELTIKENRNQSKKETNQPTKPILEQVNEKNKEKAVSENPKKQETQMKHYESLDKKYYDYYFKALPDKKKAQEEKLKQVLYKSFEKEIYKVKKSLPKDTLKKITPKTIKYEKVDLEGIWWRGIKKQLRHIIPTDYVYIVFYQKYYCLFTYITDPSKFIQSPKQAHLIFKNI